MGLWDVALEPPLRDPGVRSWGHSLRPRGRYGVVNPSHGVAAVELPPGRPRALNPGHGLAVVEPLLGLPWGLNPGPWGGDCGAALVALGYGSGAAP